MEKSISCVFGVLMFLAAAAMFLLLFMTGDKGWGFGLLALSGLFWLTRNIYDK